MQSKLLNWIALPFIYTIFILFSCMAFIDQSYAFEDGVNVYYFLEDHLGGTDVVLNEDFEVVSRYDYMPFGAERVTEGDNKESHRYTGQELDEETGLYYYGARYYDAGLGRFISVDPLVLDEAKHTPKKLMDITKQPQALNSYTYVLNNPLKFIDPEGESAEDLENFGRQLDGAWKIVTGIFGYKKAKDEVSRGAAVSTIYHGLKDMTHGTINLMAPDVKDNIDPNFIKGLNTGADLAAMKGVKFKDKQVQKKKNNINIFAPALRSYGEKVEKYGEKFGKMVRKFNDKIKESKKNKSNKK